VILVTIEEVDLTRAFVVIQLALLRPAGQNWCYHMVRAYFSSSTELTFDRGNSSGVVLGDWWVVESLDETFEVSTNLLTVVAHLATVVLFLLHPLGHDYQVGHDDV
jgi:hypothetical protein